MRDLTQRAQKGRKIASVLKHALARRHVDVLLDVGCSNAVVLDMVRNALLPRIAIGIDMDTDSLPRPTSDRFAITGDAMKLPFASDAVDVVICNHTYEHVPDARELFSEIYRVLKADGVIYFGAMNAHWPMEPHFRIPFIHWFPRWMSAPIMRWLKRGDGYFEKPLGYAELTRLTSRFERTDYTLKIIADPASYHAGDVVTKRARLFSPFARLLYGFLPGYIWILRKRAQEID